MALLVDAFLVSTRHSSVLKTRPFTSNNALQMYRCWIICVRCPYTILIPVALWLAETACSCIILYYYATLHTLATFGQVPKGKPYYIAWTAMNVLLNIITTGESRFLSKYDWHFISCSSSQATSDRVFPPYRTIPRASFSFQRTVGA